MILNLPGLAISIGIIVGVGLSLAQTYAYLESYYLWLTTEALFPFVVGFLLLFTNSKRNHTNSLAILLVAGTMGIAVKGISHAIGYRYGVGSGAFFDGLTIPIMSAFLVGQTIIVFIIILIGHGIYRWRNRTVRKSGGEEFKFEL